jgi:transposase
VRQVAVPWARPGSGFTLLFEALVMTLAREMPVKATAGLVREHDTRLWRVIHHYVDKARGDLDMSEVTRVAIDETSFRRGQDYVTPFCDLDQRRVIFVAEGRDQSRGVARLAGLGEEGAGRVAPVLHDPPPHTQKTPDFQGF